MVLLRRVQRENVTRIRVRPAIQASTVENESNEVEAEENEKGYLPLKTYLNYLFLHPSIETKYKFINVTHKVYFWFAYILSISTEIMYFKEFLFDRVKVGDVRSFIDLALTVITICTKICHLYTIVLNSPNTVPDGDLQLTKEDIGKDKWNLKKNFVYAVIGITFLQAIAQTLSFGFGFQNRSFTELILSRSYEFQTVLLIWTKTGAQNSTTRNWISAANTELSPSNAICGLFGLASDLTNYVHTTAMRNLLFVVSFGFYLKVMQWNIPLNEDGMEKVGKSVRDETEKEKMWSDYFSFRRQSRNIGEAFGPLIMFTQAQDIISCTHFLQEFFHEKEKIIFFYVVLSWNMMVLAGFICSLALAWKDGKFREWVVQNYCEDDCIVIEGREIRFQAAMEDLESHPVGIRSGGVYINFSFVATFIGILTSYFVFISPSSANPECKH